MDKLNIEKTKIANDKFQNQYYNKLAFGACYLKII